MVFKLRIYLRDLKNRLKNDFEFYSGIVVFFVLISTIIFLGYKIYQKDSVSPDKPPSISSLTSPEYLETRYFTVPERFKDSPETFYVIGNVVHYNGTYGIVLSDSTERSGVKMIEYVSDIFSQFKNKDVIISIETLDYFRKKEIELSFWRKKYIDSLEGSVIIERRNRKR